MKVAKTLGIILILCLFQESLIHSQDLSNLTLIAHYPLTSTSNDTTGNYGPMTLINTPFQDGGIYCNGNYIYDDPDSCDAFTPYITGLNFEAFAISARFKVSSYTTGSNPVFIGGGMGWRWMGVILQPDSVFGYIYNYTWPQVTNLKYVVDTWYVATVTYDSIGGIGNYYLDGVLAKSVQFQINHGDDKVISVTHSGMEIVFEGIFSDLKIYTKTNGTEVKSDNSKKPKQFILIQNYPNPFNPVTTIEYGIPEDAEVFLKIYDLKGNEVKRYHPGMLPSGTHSVKWNGLSESGNRVASGIYFYQIEAKAKEKTYVNVKKMIFMK